MLLKELANALGITTRALYKILTKNRYLIKNSYTYDECIAVSSLYMDNFITRQIIKENFNECKDSDSTVFIDGTEKWFEYYKTHPNAKCCNTCSYITGKRIHNRDKYVRPYCNLFNVFLYKMKANVYWQWCGSYDKSELLPVKWIKPEFFQQ